MRPNKVKETPEGSESVTYADGTTSVLPGDRVSLRLFFRRRAGEVIYVPGISKRRGTYEHNGLTWVGVSLPDGWAIGEIVLPETRTLKPSVRFLGRGTESLAAAEAMKRLDAKEEEEAASEAETDEPSATAAIERPKPSEWLAGLVAIALQLGMYLLVIGLIVAAILLLRNAF
jgi:hypothetical protein